MQTDRDGRRRRADGAYHEDGTALVWNEFGHLQTCQVGQVLKHAVGRMMRYLSRHGLFELEHDVDEDDQPEAALCASAVSGREPPAGPQWLRGLLPPSPSALAYDKPLCASLDGFTMHAATRAGAHLLPNWLDDGPGPFFARAG